jgi:molecular chaperone DnaK (HSP70)
VGGSSRIPVIKQTVESFFNRSVSTTLNGEESVAKGCTLIAVQLSPYHRGRKIVITDASAYGCGIKWCKEGDENNKDKQKFLMVFKKFSKYCITQRDEELSVNVSFKRTKPFSISVFYEDHALNHHYNDVPLANINVLEVPQPPKDIIPFLDKNAITNIEKGAKLERVVRVRTIMKITGCVYLDSAFIEEEYEAEDKVKVEEEVTDDEPETKVEKKKEDAPAENPADQPEQTENKDDSVGEGSKIEKEGNVPSHVTEDTTSNNNTATTNPTSNPEQPQSETVSETKTENKIETEAPSSSSSTSSSSNTQPKQTVKQKKKKKKTTYIPKKVKRTRRVNLDKKSDIPYASPDNVIQQLYQENINVVNADKILRETIDTKNVLSYIYYHIYFYYYYY